MIPAEHLNVEVSETRDHPAVWPRTWIVRVTHIPSGIFVESEPTRSAVSGKEDALARLEARLGGTI